MNPILILTRNCLELTKKCVNSVLAQDVPVSAFVIDNGSTDGTGEWLADMLGQVGSLSLGENAGVSRGWNEGLRMFFEDYDHVLVLNNDTEIPSFFYRILLDLVKFWTEEPKCLFITGASTDDPNLFHIASGTVWTPVPHPDFSAFMITREAWEKVGPFDEAMVNYASDCDWHIRAHRAGVTLWNAQIPFFHQRSSTIRLASPRDRREIELQADADREVFREIYGCYPGDQKYAELFK